MTVFHPGSVNNVHYVIVDTNPPTTDELVRLYLTAKRHVVTWGYAHEIAWQANVGQFTPKLNSFVREAAWVVLSAGMRESVIRNIFEPLTKALHGFEPSAMLVNPNTTRAAALKIFRHERKIDAVLDIADIVGRMSEDELGRVMAEEPEPFLRSLPYIGPITWRHLAKNLGLPVAKPDRHLARIAHATGRPSVDTMCAEIAAWLDEPVAVVDVVLWRWSVLSAHDRNHGWPQ